MTQFDSGRPDMWLSFAFASALLLAIRRVYEKRLSAGFGNFSLSFATVSFALPFVLALFLLLPLPPSIPTTAQFWWPLVVIWAVLYPIQNYFLYRSLREGELSEVTPVGALLPVFNMATSFALLGETLSLHGFLGIIATVVATYLLLTDLPAGATAQAGTVGFGGKSYNKPVLFMVITVLCTAVGSTLDKVAIEAATPVFYSFVNLLGASFVFLALGFFHGEGKDMRKISRYAGTFALLGAVFALAFVSFTIAFTLGPTSYTLAIRSGGFMLAALWGLVFLRESLSRRKSAALALFVLGTLALAFG